MTRIFIFASLLAFAAPAIGDECETALAATYEASRDSHKAGKLAYKEITSDVKAKALVVEFSPYNEIATTSLDAANETAHAIKEAMQAAHKAVAAVKIAIELNTSTALETALEATLESALIAELADSTAHEYRAHEIGPVASMAARISRFARVAASTASEAATVCAGRQH